MVDLKTVRLSELMESDKLRTYFFLSYSPTFKGWVACLDDQQLCIGDTVEEAIEQCRVSLNATAFKNAGCIVDDLSRQCRKRMKNERKAN